ncbi:MAG: hypothetical protein JWP44_1850 [Mucilaginibacter sp.]|nr:hypothetical protein [Mucilaginibacter sp.]
MYYYKFTLFLRGINKTFNLHNNLLHFQDKILVKVTRTPRLWPLRYMLTIRRRKGMAHT